MPELIANVKVSVDATLIEIQARVLAAQVTVEAMKQANSVYDPLADVLPYDSSHFFAKARELEDLAIVAKAYAAGVPK